MITVKKEIMCDIDGCASLNSQMTISEYEDGQHLCFWHTYLRQAAPVKEHSAEEKDD